MGFNENLEVAWTKMTIAERESLLGELAEAGANQQGWRSSVGRRRAARMRRCDDVPSALRGALIVALDGERFSVTTYKRGWERILR